MTDLPSTESCIARTNIGTFKGALVERALFSEEVIVKSEEVRKIFEAVASKIN